jgi:hypothetical protein
MESEQSKAQTSRSQKHQTEVATRSLDDLLAMAQHYRSEGDLRQAEDMFWMLVEDHAETPQSEIAKDQLRAMAHVYEHDGCAHAARAIYERLC